MDQTHADRVISTLNWLEEQEPDDEEAHEAAYTMALPSTLAMRDAALVNGNRHEADRIKAHLAALRTADMGLLLQMGYPISMGWLVCRDKALSNARSIAIHLRDREVAASQLARRLRAESR